MQSSIRETQFLKCRGAQSTARELQQYKSWCIQNTTNCVFEVISVNVILMTNHQVDHHEAL